MKSLLTLLAIMFFATTTLLAQRTDLSGLKFCIDPGHGGHSEATDRHVVPDPGIDFWESESNFQKALLLKPMLEVHGATVILTRYTNDYPTDDEPSLTARWTLANANNVNWFHSIHSNALGGTNTSTNYTMVLLKEDISTRKAAFPEAIDMSSLIYNNIRAKNRTQSSGGNIAGKQGVYLDYTFYGGPNGGYNLGVLRGLLMPGELSEGSFHDYYPETRRLMNNSYRKMEAYGILNSFLQYYGVPLDTFCTVAGIQTNSDNGKPVNATTVRILPENRVYSGDNYNNGYYLFDSLASGAHTIVFETAGYSTDSVVVDQSKSDVTFIDHTLQSLAPPFITSASPGNGAYNVSATSPIVISFTKTMDTASVRNALSITPPLDGTISWKNNSMTLTFTPRTYFQHLTNYQLTINGSAKSTSGFYLDGNGDGTGGDPYTLSFMTEAAIPPYVVTERPLPNDTSYSVTGIIGARFSRAMDTATVRAAFSITPSIDGALTFTSDRTTMTFTPVSKLPYSTAFTIRIEGTASSVDGVFIDGNKDSTAGDAFVLNFRTQDNPTAIADRDGHTPKEFALMQNYPNPFNPTTVIRFDVPSSEFVSLKVYDALGRVVKTLVNEVKTMGRYAVNLNADDLPSGVYIYRLNAGSYTKVMKMVVLK